MNTNRQQGNTPHSNQAQNKQTDAIAKELNLTRDEQRILHDEISHQSYEYQEI